MFYSIFFSITGLKYANLYYLFWSTTCEARHLLSVFNCLKLRCIHSILKLTTTTKIKIHFKHTKINSEQKISEESCVCGGVDSGKEILYDLLSMPWTIGII
jgi:hypothetical protein